MKAIDVLAYGDSVPQFMHKPLKNATSSNTSPSLSRSFHAQGKTDLTGTV